MGLLELYCVRTVPEAAFWCPFLTLLRSALAGQLLEVQH